MQCPRLTHFVRLNPDGQVSRCGHMVNPPRFESLAAMNNSQWQADIEQLFADDKFPNECVRCAETERINQTSIRLNNIHFDQQQPRPDYLIVGGVLDNVCNSACQTCGPSCSTKIGSLYSKYYPIIDNYTVFRDLPQERIVHLDINGGEPSASKNYRHLLSNLPPNVESVRINTNCSIVMPELEKLSKQGIKVTVTVSFDGIGAYHDYIRWPIKWDKFYENLMTYKSMDLHELNLWTTVSALNICNLPDILKFVEQHNFNHSYALLHMPDVLNVKYRNGFTTKAKDKLGDHIITQYLAVDRDNSIALEKQLAEQNQLRGIVDMETEYRDFYYGE